MLDVRRLALLRELAVRGSLAAVSRAVGISASAISQQLAKLEVEVGVTLLEQVGRNVQLTPAAQLLARRAEQVVAILDDAEAELEARRGQVQGVVRFAAFSTYALCDLPEVVQRMGRTHPHVAVEFTEAEPGEALDAVAGRRADIAVMDEFPRIPRRVDTGITRTQILHDRIAAYAPRPVDGIEELGELPWIFEPVGSDAYSWAQRLCREAGFEPVVAFDSADLIVHYGLVCAGVAAAFLPDMVFRSPTVPIHQPHHRLEWPHPSSEDLYRDVYVVTRRGGPARQAVAGLLRHIREVAARPGGA